MTTLSSELPPSGWYPDPAGSRRWRLWNGRDWTEICRDYAPTREPLTTRLAAVQANHVLASYGAAAYFAGVGLAIDTYHHRPGLSAPLSSSLYGLLLLVSFAMWFVGHLAYTRATITATITSPWLAGVPFLNTVTWLRRSIRRASYPIGAPATGRATVATAADGAALSQILILFALAAYSAQPLPANVALQVIAHLLIAVPVLLNIRWATAVRDDLVG